MSVVAPPLPHQPFSDSELFGASSLSSSQQLLPPPPAPPHEGGTGVEFPASGPSNGQLRLPFPPFQHRHSSPFPMTQSFSALGKPEQAPSLPNPREILSSTPPPPPPKPSTSALPPIAYDTLPVQLPPTPEPSPPVAGKILFTPVMVALAPPAVESSPPGLHVEEVRVSSDWEGSPRADEVPRRSPVVSIEDLLAEVKEPPSQEASTSRARAKTVIGSESGSNSSTGTVPEPRPLQPARKTAMGPPHHRVKRSQTANPLPKAVRMQETKSAQERARARPGLPSRRGSHAPSAPSPALQRSLTDASTPPRSHVLASSTSALPPPDLGGPDGLEAKVVLLGSQGVGKTSLILRYTTRKFTPQPATIGSSFHTRKLIQHGTQVRLQIWDTAGQERFRSMAPMYYRGSHVCILVYDISDRQSFDDVYSWLEELGRTVSKETLIFVVGMKTDLAAKRAISFGEARDTIKRWLKPPSPTVVPTPLSLPARGIFRRDTSQSRPDSAMSSPAPVRSYSHGALASLNTVEPPTLRLPALRLEVPIMPAPAREDAKAARAARPERHRSSLSISVSRPTVKVTSPTSPTQVTFPDLQSPSKATHATYSELARAALTPTARQSSRFSFSGLLGFATVEEKSEAASSLARLAEEHPPTRSTSPEVPSTGGWSPFRSTIPVTPPRIRTESSPLFNSNIGINERRRSEDWSGRSWRAGQGPAVEDVLGEFGEAVRKKASGELLVPSQQPQGSAYMRRPRGNSLGADTRLKDRDRDTPRSSISDDDAQWGVQVDHIRLGECSALTGEGVEALFKTLSAMLVDKKDNIERERILRHKNSIMLTAPEDDPAEKAAGRSCCV